MIKAIVFIILFISLIGCKNTQADYSNLYASYQGYSRIESKADFIGIFKGKEVDMLIAFRCTFDKNNFALGVENIKREVKKIEQDPDTKVMLKSCQYQRRRVSIDAMLSDVKNEKFFEGLKNLDTLFTEKLGIFVNISKSPDWIRRPALENYTPKDRDIGVKEARDSVIYFLESIKAGKKTKLTVKDLSQKHNISTKYYVYYSLRILLDKYFGINAVRASEIFDEMMALKIGTIEMLIDEKIKEKREKSFSMIKKLFTNPKEVSRRREFKVPRDQDLYRN